MSNHVTYNAINDSLFQISVLDKILNAFIYVYRRSNHIRSSVYKSIDKCM